MTTPKHRALQALADAKDRPFLAAAPLMAIVEAVAVLDEAGLLGRESDATLRSDIMAAIDNDAYDDNGEVVEAIRALLDAADPIDPDVPIPYRLAEPAPADGEDACIVCNHSAEKADLIRSAEAAIAALSNEGFPGRDVEAQVRALIREWAEEREMARLLRGAAQAETGKAQVLRSAAESIDTWGIGSRDAIACGVRTLDWVKFCEWKTEADGVKHTMIIGTSDGGGMDDARYSEFRAVLDAHRCAGARVLVDADGTSFTHPPPPPPCAKCGVQTLASGECSNFPACPNAILPF